VNGIPRYILGQCVGPLVFSLSVLTAIVWLTQSLQRIDLIVERGQTAAVFLVITLLILPSLLAVITPFALFAAVLYALHRMHSDSELVVMYAAGVSRLRLAAPLIGLGLAGVAVTLTLNLWLMPAGYRAMKERVADIRADLAGSLLRGGEFTSPTDDLTFYARQALPGGQFRGLLVYDRRNQARPVAYLAESGLFRETLNGPQLLMAAGNIQRLETGDGGDVSFLFFDQYALDMSQFAKPTGEFQLELTERFLSELLHPDFDYRWDRDNAGRLVAEGHNRRAAVQPGLCFDRAHGGDRREIRTARLRHAHPVGRDRRHGPAGVRLHRPERGGRGADMERGAVCDPRRRDPGGAVSAVRRRPGARGAAPRAGGGVSRVGPFDLTLYRYLAARVARAAFAVLASLLVLIVLIDLVELLRSLGARPGVGFADILLMALLRAPKLAEALMPFVFLFGCMWAMAGLNRRSELVVMRAAGLSAWRIMTPALSVAAAAGLATVLVINPIGAGLMDRAERMRSASSGERADLVTLTAGGLWLRQTDGDRTAVIHADRLEEKGLFLEEVTVFLYDGDDGFQRRLDAATGQLRNGDLLLFDCYINKPDQSAEFKEQYSLPTPFSEAQLREGSAPPETMSVWELPRFIRLAKDAGFPAVRHEMHWHNLLATPFKLCAMALIAGAFAMQQRRGGGGFQLVLLGVAAGFGLYVAAELAEAVGESGLNIVALAAWTPTIVAGLLATTLLLHLEDG